MTAPALPPPDALAQALAAARAAADDGEVGALEQAVGAGLEVCAAWRAGGHAPDPAALADLVRLQEQVLASASTLRDQLGAALERAGRSRRAASAYRDR